MEGPVLKYSSDGTCTARCSCNITFRWRWNSARLGARLAIPPPRFELWYYFWIAKPILYIYVRSKRKRNLDDFRFGVWSQPRCIRCCGSSRQEKNRCVRPPPWAQENRKFQGPFYGRLDCELAGSVSIEISTFAAERKHFLDGATISTTSKKIERFQRWSLVTGTIQNGQNDQFIIFSVFLNTRVIFNKLY